jgi:Nucleotidyl transferase AbiEii toxin, Type IV TA system
MGNRPSGDVDLFTSWQHRGEFPELTAAVVAALEVAGYKVSVIMSAETFTRLTLASAEGGAEEKVELAVDWRAHEPVQLAVGPVLHSDDAVANKVCALFGRALPRDFLDVDAAVMRGRYTRATAGTRCRSRPRLRPAAVCRRTRGANADYRRRVRRVRTDPGMIGDMRHRFAQWRRELLAADSG